MYNSKVLKPHPTHKQDTINIIYKHDDVEIIYNLH